ncbi:MAG TPA: serine hydrolase [Candidatus Paceibacterota bacterium]|nr:serine hydrolase [Candidatus Paceibacterota bacterium]
MTKGATVATQAAIAVATLALGCLVGYRAGESRRDAITPQVLRQNASDYHFINPIIVFTIGDKENFPEYKPLESKVASYVQAAAAKGDASSVSLYFRDLSDESWTGISENDKYAPSSMLKVAVLIAYLKLSESDPGLLERRIQYSPQVDPGQTFKPTHSLAPGLRTVEEVLQSMIDESDNSSVQSLINAQKEAVMGVYADLGLPVPKDPTDIDFMSARLYSRLFRALYNGTYLSKALSEKALEILSKTDFDQGIVAGLPAHVQASHKFGERTIYETSTGKVLERQLHDCGIVYAPAAPYFVCVMTKGSDFSKLQAVISDISKIVYQSASSKAQK